MTSTHSLELNLLPPNENISQSEFQALFMAECYQETASTLDILPTRFIGFLKFPNMYVKRNHQHGIKSTFSVII
uniref:Uncharacterized protein n=1 Tax=Brassica campestris TaxID=3711 RepID=A0A3P5Y350_BRACM|nr:unnamed protein product [Brassica rapa]